MMESQGGPAPHEEHEEAEHPPEQEEPWLVSYADLMTLLFGFFVLMYTFVLQKVDPDRDTTVRVRKEVAKYFGGEFQMPLEQVEKDFRTILDATSLSKNVQTKLSPEGLEVTFISAALYNAGSAELRPDAEGAMIEFIKLVKEKGENFDIKIEGHTDDRPIVSSTQFASNWELSGIRATTVVRLFEGMGFPSRYLSAIGYGSARPVAANRDASGKPIEENMARNRRVIIKVMQLD